MVLRLHQHTIGYTAEFNVVFIIYFVGLVFIGSYWASRVALLSCPAVCSMILLLLYIPGK